MPQGKCFTCVADWIPVATQVCLILVVPPKLYSLMTNTRGCVSSGGHLRKMVIVYNHKQGGYPKNGTKMRDLSGRISIHTATHAPTRPSGALDRIVVGSGLAVDACREPLG